MDFYPSISWDLLLKSLNQSRNYVNIKDEEIDILMCRKSILTDSQRTWVKNYIDNFDVPMRSYDTAHRVDQIGIYILDMLGRIIDL